MRAKRTRRLRRPLLNAIGERTEGEDVDDWTLDSPSNVSVLRSALVGDARLGGSEAMESKPELSLVSGHRTPWLPLFAGRLHTPACEARTHFVSRNGIALLGRR